MLELVNITKQYPAVAGQTPSCVLNNINLKIQDGDAAAIIGPSGSGKSTLLNIIGTLDKPTSGQVLLNGIDITDRSDKELAQIRSSQIGFVFQLHHLLPQCTVLENVLIPMLASKQKQNHDELTNRAKSLLDRVGLKDKLNHRPPELSAGQRQRAAIVRALINNPKLLLADEPTGSLDTVASQSIAELLVELNKTERVSMIVVTHSAKLASCMPKIFEITNGRLMEANSSK